VEGKSLEPERLLSPGNGDESESPEWALVMRVASSELFQRTPRLRAVLLYICRHTFSGNSEALDERQIGVDVFGKPEGYDTGVENTVRVSVSALRRRLALYFGTEGRASPLVIEIPRGKYKPVFRLREERRRTGTTVPVSGAALSRMFSSKTVLDLIVVVVISVLVAVTIWLWTENRKFRAETELPRIQNPALRHFWSSVFSPSQRTDIVVTDAGLALIKAVTGEAVSLQDYVNGQHFEHLRRSPLGEASWPLLDHLSHRSFTSAASVRLSLRIGLLNRHVWNQGTVLTPSSLETRHFGSHNFVLLGSRRSNPWIHLFEPQMKFRVEFDPSVSAPFINNLSPQPGEEAVYRPSPPHVLQEDLYAVVALLPNLEYSGQVLIIAGTGMEATEAAGDFLTRDSFSAEFFERLGFGQKNEPIHFEAVVHAQFAGGSGISPKVIAHRVIAPAYWH
jgi:hypothetical protein